MNAKILSESVFRMQACVPKHWPDALVEEFVNEQRPAGTKLGWTVCKEGHELLNGDPERVQCHECAGNYHILLSC